MEEEIEQPGYGVVFAPHTITSGGLGPCSSVGAIYRDEAHLSHDVCLGLTPPKRGFGIDCLLGQLQERVEDVNGLKIYVVGAGIDSDDDESDLEIRDQDRKITLDKIAKAGFSDRIIQVRWNDRLDSTQALILDPGKSVAFCEEYLNADPEETFRIHPMQ